MPYARLCLNNNQYTKPSGGFKAHSNSKRDAFSHESGIGYEEWLNSDLLRLSGSDLKNLKNNGFKDVKPEEKYQIGFIEATKANNNSRLLRHKQWLSDLVLVILDQPNSWFEIGKIDKIRQLDSTECGDIFDYFNNTRSSRNVANTVIQEMLNDITNKPNVPPIVFNTPFTPLNGAMNRNQASDVFSCIFRVEDLHFHHAPIPQHPTPRNR